MAACVFCACPALTSPAGENPDLGDPVICGGCGSLMVIDFTLDDEGAPVGIVRRPTREESVELRQRPEVAEMLKLFNVAIIEDAARPKPKQVIRPGRLEAFGPDHPRSRR